MDALKQLLRYLIIGTIALVVTMPALAQESTISYLSPVDGEITNGEPQAWTFQAVSGEVLSFSVEATSGDLDPAFTISNLAGMVLIGNDDYNYPDEQNSLLEAITIPRTGTYTVTIAGVGNSVGIYTLTMLPGFAEVERNENFNGDLNWEITGETGELDAIDGKLSLAVEGRLQTAIVQALDNDLPERYYAKVMINVSGGNGWITGMTARQNGDRAYMLAVSSNGQWRFSTQEAGTARIIRDWTPHPAIVPGEANFSLSMLVNHTGFDFFYNGQLLGRLNDNSLPQEGGIGVFVGTPDSLTARATSTFDDAIVTTPIAVDDEPIIPQALMVGTPADTVQELQRRGLIPANGEMALTVNESFVESRRPGIEQLLLGRGTTFQDFAMGATVTWQAQAAGVTGCGIVIRATDTEHFTVAYIDQTGGYGVSQREGESFQPGIFGEKAELTGNTHHLLIVVRGDSLYYYIDGQYAGTAENPMLEGGVGNAVVNFDPISTSCQYTGTWLWQWEEN